MHEFKLKRTLVILFLAIVVSSLAVVAYNYFSSDRTSYEPEKKVEEKKKKVLNVNAIVVKTQTLTDDITTVGNLIPDEEVDLTFETSGKVTNIFFQEGTFVEKGTLLAKVNDNLLRAQLSKYESQIKLAEDRVYRQSALLQKDAVSKEAYEQATTELAILKAEISHINASIALTELHAPFDGIIGLRNVSEGAYATPTVEVAKLTKISPLKIDMYLPERYASSIKVGTHLTFSLEGDNREYSASIYAIEPKVDVKTRTVAVRAVYPNSRNELHPGRFVTVKIRMSEIANAIAIPTEAVVPEMGVDKVFKYSSGKVHSVPITSGLRTESLIHVIEGLKVGDTIVTSGTLQLREALPVTLDSVN